MRKVVLVTGGTGLLGTAMKRMFYDYHDKDDVGYFVGKEVCDLESKEKTHELFTSLRPTHVIHLAAMVGGLFYNMENNLDFFEKNVSMNMNVLHECYKSTTVKKVISCMSTCVFPDGIELPLTSEKMHLGLPHHSNIGYSFAKRMIDVENRMLYTVKKPFIGIIPTNLFGPGDNYDIEQGHVIPSLIHKCYLAKRDGTDLFVRGSGNAKRQFLYSKDAARLIWRICSNYNGSEPLILAPPEEYSIKEVVDMIVEIFEFKGNVRYTDMLTIGNSSLQDGQARKTADGSKILKLYTNFHFTDFYNALQETIRNFITMKETIGTRSDTSG